MTEFGVTSAARIHVGLHQLANDFHYAYGGLGFFLTEFSWHLKCRLSNQSEINVSDLVSSDLRAGATRLLAELDKVLGGPGCFVTVSKAIEEHVGLGSKTALLTGLLYARCRAAGQLRRVEELLPLLRRGGTSGVGINRFNGGGIVLDAGQPVGSKFEWAPSRYSFGGVPSRLAARWSAPSAWRPLIVVPSLGKRVSGFQERQFFNTHLPLSRNQTSEIAEVVLFQLIPAVVYEDFREFCAAIKMLQSIGLKRLEWLNQSEQVLEVRDILYSNGARVVGLSSLGPTLFAFFDDPNRLLPAVERDLQSTNFPSTFRLVGIENRSMLELNA